MITGLKGLAADGHEINCRTCRSGKTCNVANAHGYWVGACVRYSPEKPMTNADRIRAMTNEELAKNLSEFFGECAFVHIPHREGTMPPCSFYDFDCQKCWLEWLKQEVPND